MTSMAASANDNTPQGPASHVLVVKPEISLIAWTTFDSYKAHELTGFSTDVGGGQAIAEFAGRACYQSFDKPNPKTATNEGYLEHILEVQHESVLEHGTATIYFTGVSRSFTHELIRHRHFSYSQLSQRYVPEHAAKFVEPDIIANNPELHAKWLAAVEAARKAYVELEQGLYNSEELSHIHHSTARKKKAREAARSVLPNATETRIVVTGNYRAWRHFIAMRATEHADVEIRTIAVELYRLLNAAAPHMFQDMVIQHHHTYGYPIVVTI
jgi:thymidylate synthase (FAD)